MFFPSKKATKVMKWAFFGGFAIDAAVIAGAYYSYHQLKNSSDFRYKIYKYDERWIDVYYKANEKYGDGSARKIDYENWGISDVKKYENLSFIEEIICHSCVAQIVYITLRKSKQTDVNALKIQLRPLGL